MSTRYETPWCLLCNMVVFQRGRGRGTRTKSSLQQMLLKLMEAVRNTGPSHLTLGTLRPLLRLMAASVAWVPQIYTDFHQTKVMRIKENQVSDNSSSQYHWKWKWVSLRAGSLLLLCSRFGNRGKRMAWVLDFFSSMRNVQRALDVSVRVCLRLPTHFPSCMPSFAASVEHGGRNSEKRTSIFYRLPPALPKQLT